MTSASTAFVSVADESPVTSTAGVKPPEPSSVATEPPGPSTEAVEPPRSSTVAVEPPVSSTAAFEPLVPTTVAAEPPVPSTEAVEPPGSSTVAVAPLESSVRAERPAPSVVASPAASVCAVPPVSSSVTVEPPASPTTNVVPQPDVDIGGSSPVGRASQISTMLIGERIRPASSPSRAISSALVQPTGSSHNSDASGASTGDSSGDSSVVDFGSDDSDASDAGPGRPGYQLVVKRPAASMREVGLTSSGESEDESDGSDDEADAVIETNTRGNVIRLAAKAAMEYIRLADWKPWRPATRRRIRSGDRESKTEDDDPEEGPSFVESLLRRLVDKKIEDGVVLYRADWVEYDTPEGRYTWEPVEHLRGHEEWMKLVDQWKQDHEGRGVIFSAFVKNNVNAIRLGDGDEMLCFFYAAESARRLLRVANFDITKLTQRVKAKRIEVDGGVLKSAAVLLMQAMVLSGLAIDSRVWAVNRHQTEYGPGHVDVCTSVEAGLGVYMVATMDALRVGHCWTLSVSEDGLLTAYDNGVETSFSSMHFDHIFWVRR